MPKLPRTVPDRDLYIAEIAGVSEGRVMDMVTGASILIANLRDTAAAADLDLSGMPKELQVANKLALDAYDQWIYALDTGDTSHMTDLEEMVYLAFFDRMVGLFAAEHFERMQQGPLG